MQYVVYYDAEKVKSRLLLALHYTLRSSSSAWQILVFFYFFHDILFAPKNISFCGNGCIITRVHQWYSRNLMTFQPGWLEPIRNSQSYDVSTWLAGANQKRANNEVDIVGDITRKLSVGRINIVGWHIAVPVYTRKLVFKYGEAYMWLR